MRFRLLLPLLVLSLLSAVAATKDVAPKPSFCEPSLSPDGSEIVFVSGGDIWTAPAAGGEARLLVSHPATETRPLFSPDGKYLAFTSTRSGNGNIYVLTLASGELKRLTFDQGNESLEAWSRDSKWIYFSSSSRDISGMTDIFRVSASGGTPMPVTADRYAAEYFAAPSPDGSVLAFTGTGSAGGQWWRKGHSHMDEGQIWVMKGGPQPQYQRLSEGGAKEAWPMWAPDGRVLYYMSDRVGAQNIWTRPAAPAGKPRQVTRFTDGRVLWPSISLDGRTIVFERNFAIWKLDTASGQAREVSIKLHGTPAGPVVEHRSFNNFGELALSPDGKKLALLTHGEVFAAAAKDGGDAARVTRTNSAESQVAWASDSRRLVYVSDRDGHLNLFLYDFEKNQETRLTEGASEDHTPLFSPDGKSLAFQRNGSELCVLDMETKQVRVLARGQLERPPLNTSRPMAWSPDSKWIAYLSTAGKMFKNAYIVPAAGGESRQASFLPNVFTGSLTWSPDGAFLLFVTGQRTETSQVARVELVPRTPKFREDLFRDLFKPEDKPKAGMVEEVTSDEWRVAGGPPFAPLTTRHSPLPAAEQAPAEKAKPVEAKKTPKPVEIVFEGIRERVSLLPVEVEVNDIRISPDGKTLLMTAGAAGQVNLYTWSLDEMAKEPPVARQITSTARYKSNAQFSPDSKEVFYLEQGQVQTVALESRQPKPVAVTAEMDVDFNAEKIEAFEQAWKGLREWFFDPGMNDVNWQAVHDQYAPQIAGARTSDEMRRLLSLMVGELNASHLGVSGPSGAPGSQVGRLGLTFDRAEYEANGRLRVTQVIPLGPAAVGIVEAPAPPAGARAASPASDPATQEPAAAAARTAAVKPGDYLLAVDGGAIASGVNLDQLLEHKVGRRVVLTVASEPAATKREVVVRPVNLGTEKRLLYRQWVENNRAYVERISNGRLGYVHMPDMGSDSLTQLYADLDTQNHAREGVVVDVRNNNGGFVNVYAIDVLARRPYLTMAYRDRPPAPARTVLGQRALVAAVGAHQPDLL